MVLTPEFVDGEYVWTDEEKAIMLAEWERITFPHAPLEWAIAENFRRGLRFHKADLTTAAATAFRSGDITFGTHQWIHYLASVIAHEVFHLVDFWLLDNDDRNAIAPLLCNHDPIHDWQREDYYYRLMEAFAEHVSALYYEDTNIVWYGGHELTADESLQIKEILYNMTWRLAPALQTLRDQINALWPDRNKDVDGAIGDAAHRNRVSDHNPDSDQIVTAIDITDDDSVGADMRVLAEVLRVNNDPRIKYVIHEGRMFSSYPTSSYPAWTWRPYSGLNGHFSHLHISVTQAGKYDNYPWVIEGDDDGLALLTEEELQTVREINAALKGVGSNGSAMAPIVRLVRVMRQIDDIFEQEEF